MKTNIDVRVENLPSPIAALQVVLFEETIVFLSEVLSERQRDVATNQILDLQRLHPENKANVILLSEIETC